MKLMRIVLPLAAVGAFLLPASAAWAQTATVSVVDNDFDPAQIEVSSGTTITWTNDGDTPHTVTADNGSFESGNLDPGDSFEQTFTEAGEYSYFCDYHGSEGGTGMSGVVTVTDDGTDDPTDPADDNGNGDGDGNEDSTDTLPETGVDILAYVYLALAFIGVGAIFWRLDRSLS